MQLNPIRRTRQRGLGLIDALVALSMLAFGMLGMTRMQTRLITQGSDVQTRLTASRAAEELLGMVLADSANATCYTLPATGTCTSTTASASAATWRTATLASLPTYSIFTVPTAVATLDSSTGLFKVLVTWGSKTSTLGTQSIADAHNITVTTDVRQ
jgi:type IV pilus assembly protein PilV